MIVNTNEHINTIYDLIDGTVFRYDDSYYIKTTEYHEVKRLCGCVNIETGAFDWLIDNMTVAYYEAEVTLK